MADMIVNNFKLMTHILGSEDAVAGLRLMEIIHAYLFIWSPMFDYIPDARFNRLQ